MIKLQLIIPAIFLFSGYIHLQAQNGTVSSGGDATGSGGSVSYSIGKTDYIAPIGSGGNSNEGLQQPYEIFTTGIDDDQISLELSIYPNPTTASVFLKIEKENMSNLFFQLYDVNGAQLSSYVITDKTTQIAMEQYASGTYFIKVIQTNTILKTFKIIKK
jgi:Secretion system C-terminal sorting domain